MRSTHLLLLALALSPSLPAVAAAQGCSEHGCTATNTVRVHVGTILRLGVQGSTTIVATAGEQAFASGTVASAGPTAVVRSNGAWRLEVSAAQPTWTALDGSARSDKPVADLSWSTDERGGFTNLSEIPNNMARGAATTGVALPLLYRARFAPESDTPGSYAVTIRLTLVGA